MSSQGLSFALEGLVTNLTRIIFQELASVAKLFDVVLSANVVSPLAVIVKCRGAEVAGPAQLADIEALLVPGTVFSRHGSEALILIH